MRDAPSEEEMAVMRHVRRIAIKAKWKGKYGPWEVVCPKTGVEADIWIYGGTVVIDKNWTTYGDCGEYKEHHKRTYWNLADPEIFTKLKHFFRSHTIDNSLVQDKIN